MIKTLIALSTALLISGCLEAQDPNTVAQQYWQA
jgi:hypothetical protein